MAASVFRSFRRASGGTQGANVPGVPGPRVVAAVFLLSAIAWSTADAPFETVRSGHPVEHRGISRGVAWGDYDGDGDADLFVSHPTWEDPPQRNALYRNDGGTFVPVRSAVTTAPPGGWEGAAWIDVDGDGDLDLHTVGRNGAGSRFFENRGGGELVDRPTDPFGGRVTSASMACWADADGDGWLDVFVTGYRADSNRLFRNLGDWSMAEVPLPTRGRGDGSARACVWADLDGDRHPELVIANARQPNVLLRNRGSLRLVADTTAPLHRDVTYSYGVSAADVDGDGRQDIFVANFDAGNSLYLGRADGSLEAVALGESLQSAASKGHTWGDFDLDGELDLYLGSGTPGPGMVNRLYLGRGGGVYELSADGEYATHADTSAGIAAADFDLDGDLDLFVANWGGPGSADRLYANTASGRRWLRVQLQGVASNRMGVGARVSVLITTDGGRRWVHRWLGTSTGYAGQNEPVLHFGLGRASAVDSLVVAWPSGAVDRRVDVPTNGLLRVREGG